MENTTNEMRAEVDHGKDLIYLTIYPEEYDASLNYPLIILLHGFGASMYDLAELTRFIDTRGYLYVCPNAPIPVPVSQGVLGFAWNLPGTDDPEQSLRTERKLDGFRQEVMEKHRIAPGRTILLGFPRVVA